MLQLLQDCSNSSALAILSHQIDPSSLQDNVDASFIIQNKNR